jgi:uncharacterized protein (TIGR02145 family)
MKKLLLFKLIFFLTFFVQSQKIKEVKIGDQIWMSENLNVDKFRNGDLIPEVKTKEEWIAFCVQGKPAWCFYDNDPKNGDLYGKLYNYYAVIDPRGLAPEGWRIPSTAKGEFKTLRQNLPRNQKKRACFMKSTEHWEVDLIVKLKDPNYKNQNGNNKSGFNAYPNGYRFFDGSFGDLGKSAYWWRIPQESDSAVTYYVNILSYSSNPFRNNNGTGGGFAVRCVKD